MSHDDYDYFDDTKPGRSTNEADVEIIRLYDQDGNELPFRKVYEANIRKKIYYILLPQFEIPNNEANQALVFQVTRFHGGKENYEVVVDDFIVNEVFDAYNESLMGEEHHEIDEADVPMHRAIESRFPLADEPGSRLVDLPISDVFQYVVEGQGEQSFKKLSGILFRGRTFLLTQPQFYAGPGGDPDPVVFEVVPNRYGGGLALDPIGYDDDLYYTCLAIYIRKTTQQNYGGAKAGDDYFGGGSGSDDDYF